MTTTSSRSFSLERDLDWSALFSFSDGEETSTGSDESRSFSTPSDAKRLRRQTDALNARARRQRRVVSINSCIVYSPSM